MKTQVEIDFASFVDSMRRDIDLFAHWYAQKHRESPESYPLKMWPGDWSEQFMLFDPDLDEEDE